MIFAWKKKPLRSSSKIRALLRCHEKLEHAPTAARVTIVETPGLAGRSLSDPNTKARGIHGCEGRRKGKGEGYVLMLAHSGSCTRIVQAIRLLAAAVVPVYTNEVLLHQTPYYSPYIGICMCRTSADIYAVRAECSGLCCSSLGARHTVSAYSACDLRGIRPSSGV